jgi:hypothetical protein
MGASAVNLSAGRLPSRSLMTDLDVRQILALLSSGEHQLQVRIRFHLGERLALVKSDAGAKPLDLAQTP